MSELERPEFPEGFFPHTIELSQGAIDLMKDVAKEVLKDSGNLPKSHQEDCVAFLSEASLATGGELVIYSQKAMCGYIGMSILIQGAMEGGDADA